MNRSKFDGCFGYHHSKDEGCKACALSLRCRRTMWIKEEVSRPYCFGNFEDSNISCIFCGHLPFCRNCTGDTVSKVL